MSENKKIKCNKCNGSRFIPIGPGIRGMKKCPECNGTGIVAYIKDDINNMQVIVNGKIEDLSAMIVGAERYALGRKTYIVQWTCEFIKNNLHLITNKDRQVMIRDIENPISYGDECDKECWMQLLEILKKRGNENV